MRSGPSVRDRLLSDLADRLPHPSHPLRVAVDGITAAGKSTFAAALTAAVAAQGRPARHLSTDDHHHPAARRRRDPDPARGYYRDAYDLTTVRERVLEPLGQGGDRLVLARSHDLSTDAVLADEPERVPEDTVVVVDGSFLRSGGLADRWDVVVWLEVPWEVAVERAVLRDSAALGGAGAVREAFARRYHAACRLYVAEHDPRARATYVVDNTDPAAPRLLP